MYYISIERNGNSYYLKDLVSLSHEPSKGSDYSDGMFYAEWTPMFEDRNVFRVIEDAEDIIDNYTKKGEIHSKERLTQPNSWTANTKWTVSS